MTRRNRTATATTYNGVDYRSRLEARWACTFDLIEWDHEYEPFVRTHCPYLPDFWIATLGVYAEIKPWRIGAHYQRPEWPEVRAKIAEARLDAPVILLGATYGFQNSRSLDPTTSADCLAYGMGEELGWAPANFPNDSVHVRYAWTRAGNTTRWKPGRAA